MDPFRFVEPEISGDAFAQLTYRFILPDIDIVQGSILTVRACFNPVFMQNAFPEIRGKLASLIVVENRGSSISLNGISQTVREYLRIERSPSSRLMIRRACFAVP